MDRCIYSYSQLNDNEPPDAQTRSVEHIVPWSIGGCNEVTTKDASKKLNNDLGSAIDAPFSNLLPIAILRHQLRIKGNSGTIPPIIWDLRADTGEPVRMEIAHDGAITYSVQQVVINEEHKNFRRVLLGGSKAQVDQMLAGMLKKCRTRGEQIYSETGVAITSADDYLRFAESEVAALLGGKVQLFDAEVWMRGIAKMTLGLGHLVLGSDWTFGTDADRYRTVLMQERRLWPSVVMRGFAAGTIPTPIRQMLGIDEQVRDRRCHTLAFLPADVGKPQFIAISLFGGDGVPEALVSVGTERGRLATINDELQKGTVLGFRVDPCTRQAQPITVSDLYKNTP